MIIAFFINIFLVLQNGFVSVYGGMMFIQMGIYIAAILGWVLEKREMKVKIFFIPYYFCLMNYAVIIGMFRYLFKEQSVLWEKAKRR